MYINVYEITPNQINPDITEQVKPIRTEAYNFKRQECHQFFKLLTKNTQMFSMRFKSTNTFPNQLKFWQKRLKSYKGKEI